MKYQIMKKYREYARDLMFLFPPLPLICDRVRMEYEFGLSNPRADIDNPVKAFQDVLFAKWGIDDHIVHEMTIRKVIVPKGQEYIKFEVNDINKGGG